MKINLLLLITLSIFAITQVSCKKKGCTDPLATNYNSNAKKNDGSCKYAPVLNTSATVEHVVFGTDDRQHLDLHLPINHDNTTKTIIMIHGGAWVLGTNHTDSVKTFGASGIVDIVSELLDEGYACAIMKYRLACYTSAEANLTDNPNFYIDDMLEDVDLAIDKLKEDATTLGISDNNFALIGESAGANIALLYGLKNTSDPDLKTVISMFAPTLMDETQFKTNLSSAPYNNLPVINDVYIRKFSSSCNVVTNENVNFMWGLNSLCGKKLSINTTNPTYTDVLSPAITSNIQRNIPVFLMHGESDDLVPSGHADSMLVQLNTVFGTSPASASDFTSQHKMLKYQNCGHGWSGSCVKSIIKMDVLKWMQAHF